MGKLISNAEKIIKSLYKKGSIEILDNSQIEEIFDKVDKDMEDYRMDNNYKRGQSQLDAEKIWIN